MNHRLEAVRRVALINDGKVDLTDNDWQWNSLVKVTVLYGLSDVDRRTIASNDNAIQNSGTKTDLLEVIQQIRSAVSRCMLSKNPNRSVGPYEVLASPSHAEMFEQLKGSLYVHFKLPASTALVRVFFFSLNVFCFFIEVLDFMLA